MYIRPCNAAVAKICFNHLMPGENRSVAVMFSRKCAQVHNMIYTVSLCRIDQCFALHKHVNCISSYKKDPRDVFQCLIESSWIIEIDKARCSKLIGELFQIRFPSRPYRQVCLLVLLHPTRAGCLYCSCESPLY